MSSKNISKEINTTVMLGRKQIIPQPKNIPIFDDLSSFKNKKIGITGSTGILGKIICSRFKNANIDIKSYPGDITEIKTLSNWFDSNRFDYFFHFAAIVPINKVNKNPLKAYEVNAIGMYSVAKLIIETQSNCWSFFASSSHVYKVKSIGSKYGLKVGDNELPKSFYGITKLAGEKISIPLLDYFNIDYCIGRIFSFTGYDQKAPFLVPSLIEKIKKLDENNVLEIYNHNSVRDIIDAETVIDCILHLAQKKYCGIINIGSGIGKNIAEIAKEIALNYKKEIKLKGIRCNNADSLIANVTELMNLVKE